MNRDLLIAPARDGPDQPLVPVQLESVKLVLSKIAPILARDFAHRHKLTTVGIEEADAVDAALLLVVENFHEANASRSIELVAHPCPVLQTRVVKLACVLVIVDKLVLLSNFA